MRPDEFMRPDATAPQHTDGGDAIPADPDLELLELLDEAEERVERLRTELERLNQQRLEGRLNAEQHAEISRLAEYLEAATVNWHKVREFFSSAIREYRADAPWDEADQTTDTVPGTEERP